MPEETTSKSNTLADRWKTILAFPWHPFLFSAAVLVGMMSTFMYFKEPDEFVLPFIYFELITGVLFAITTLVMKDVWKAANTLTVFLVLLFSFRPVFLADGKIEPTFVQFAIWLICTVWLVSYIAKHRIQLGQRKIEIEPKSLSGFFTNASIALLAIYLIRPISSFDAINKNYESVVKPFNSAFDSLQLKGSVKPDIYFILVDALANERTFAENWHFDSSYFRKYLQAKGFYVVDHARSNYHETCVSLPCELNMQYLDPMIAKKDSDWQPLPMAWRAYQGAAIFRVFKKNGYRIVNIADGDSVTCNLKMADSNIHSCWWNEACFYSLLNTPLIFADRYVHILSSAYVRSGLSPEYSLDEAISQSGPKFVMIHTDLVHPPGLVDKNGHLRDLTPNLVFDTGQPQNYIEQFQWGEPILERWIDKILEKTDRKAVIVIQSDHGTYYPPAKEDKEGLDSYYNERMRIINAMYLPGMNNKGLYDWITPVNTFRVIFNDYFDAKLPLLPDKAFCNVLPESYPLDVKEVSDRLHW